MGRSIDATCFKKVLSKMQWFNEPRIVPRKKRDNWHIIRISSIHSGPYGLIYDVRLRHNRLPSDDISSIRMQLSSCRFQFFHSVIWHDNSLFMLKVSSRNVHERILSAISAGQRGPLFKENRNARGNAYPSVCAKKKAFCLCLGVILTPNSKHDSFAKLECFFRTVLELNSNLKKGGEKSPPWRQQCL